MIYKIITILFLLTSLILGKTGISLEQQEYNGFTEKQLNCITHAYELGKPFDLGHTMAAIAWQESRAGVYLVNMQDPSAGVFHNNLKSVLARHEELRDTGWQRNRIAQRLIESIDFSGAEALAELKYWQSVHGDRAWLLIWQSYNGGFAFKRPNSKGYKASLGYSHKLSRKVQFLIMNEIFETKEVKPGES